MRTAVVITNQFRAAKAEQSSIIKYMMTDNAHEWYIMIKDLETMQGDASSNIFHGGEYLVKIVIPSDYPLSPPEFYFMTPTGVFGMHEKVCVALGEGCPPTIVGYVNTLLAKLLDWRNQTDIQQTTIDDKKHFANISKMYNDIHHHEIIKKLRDL